MLLKAALILTHMYRPHPYIGLILNVDHNLILPVILINFLKVRWFHHNIIECFHSRGQHICKFIETKESVYIRKEFNSHRTGLGHQHGRRFIVLGHQYGRRDVMWKHSIGKRLLEFLRMGLVWAHTCIWLFCSLKLLWHPCQVWQSQ